jgi:maleate isomerase
MHKPKRLGMLVPSSNTLVEPVCSRMVNDVPEVDCYYSRFPVTHISLEQSSLKQFDFEPMLKAAELLAHADVDVIAWNGASGSWFGADIDRELCAQITKITGIPATTATLALLDAFERNHVKTCHLITPYIPEMNDLIMKQYKSLGIETIHYEGCALTVNWQIGSVSKEKLENMIQNVTSSPADAISVPCTNFPVINHIEYFENKYNHTIYDTIAVVVKQSMEMVGVDPSKVKGWGRLFRLNAAN